MMSTRKPKLDDKDTCIILCLVAMACMGTYDIYDRYIAPSDTTALPGALEALMGNTQSFVGDMYEYGQGDATYYGYLHFVGDGCNWTITYSFPVNSTAQLKFTPVNATFNGALVWEAEK